MAESEKQRLVEFDLLFKAMSQGVVFCDSGGRIISMNPAAQKLLHSTDLSNDKATFGPEWRAIHEDGSIWPIIDFPALEVLRTGKSVCGVLMGIQGRNGKIFRWFSVSSTPLFRPGETEAYRVYSIFEDITRQKRFELDLMRRLEVEQLISTIGARFVGEPIFDVAVNDSLADLGGLIQAGRAYLFLLRDDRLTMDNTHEWCAPGVSPEAHNLQNIPIDFFPWIIEQLRRGDTVHIADVSALPPEAKTERAEFEKENIKSIIVMPLGSGDELVGFVGLDNVMEASAWRPEDEALLSMVAKIINSAIEHRNFQTALFSLEQGKNIKSLIESAPSVIIYLSKDRRILEFNPAAEKLYGKKRSEVVGRDYFKLFIPEEVRDSVIKDMHKVLESEPSLGFENEVIAPGGKRLTMEWYVGRYLDSAGKAAGTVAIGNDITKRKKTEEDLRFKSQLLDNATDSIFVYDFNGETIYVNEASFVTRGYTKDELISLSRDDLLALDSEKSVKLRLETLTKTGSVTFESAHIKKDGTIVDVENHSSIIHLGSRPVIVNIVRDITERKRAENAIRASEQRYRTLAESALDYIFIINSNYLITYVNSYAAGKFRVAPEILINSRLDAVFPPESAARMMSNIDDVFRDKKAVSAENNFDFGGHQIWLETHLNPIFDDSGKVTDVMGVSHDITDRKEAAELTGALNDINNLISSTLDFDKILRSVMIEAARTLGSESAWVILRFEDSWVIRYQYGGHHKQEVGKRFRTDEEPIIGIVSHSKQPLIINNIADTPPPLRQSMERLGAKSLLDVPLLARGEVVGLVGFCHVTKDTSFTENQIDFASKLAVSLSLAFENSRIFAQERNIADTLQKALLVLPNNIDGLEYGHLYRSASSAAQVGGDFYDLIELDNHRVGIVVGDVSGKGLEAATLTSLVKNTIKAYCFDEDRTSVIMEKANGVITKSSEDSVFVTLFFGIIDLGSGELRYCSAGHPPAIIKRNNKAAFLKSNSPAIGIFENQIFREDTVILSRNDILFLYTDGLIEGRLGDEFYGEEKLINYLSGLIDTNVNDVPEAVYQELMRFTNGRLLDDMALLTVSLINNRARKRAA